MPESKSAGLQGVAALQLSNLSRQELPVIICFTGHPTYMTCVDAMRMGAWDYVSKEDIGDRSAAQVVVDSAIARLSDLDHWHALQKEITDRWIPANPGKLAQNAGGLVALWDDPEIHIVAAGNDAFDLEQDLASWRASHAIWQQPFILKVPPEGGSDGEQS